jgi:hypothetical protein
LPEALGGECVPERVDEPDGLREESPDIEIRCQGLQKLRRARPTGTRTRTEDGIIDELLTLEEDESD